MTVSSTTGKSGPYNGNGVTVAFEYEFRILDAAHVTVILNSAGAETVLTLADYSVSGVGDSGGSVTLNTAPATGETITIVRNAPFTQALDLENQGAYYAETVEQALDLAAMRDQQLSERLDRAIQIPVSADAAELDVLISAIVRIGDSTDEIDTVAAIAADVTAVAGMSDAVMTVAGIAEAILAVPEAVSAAQTAEANAARWAEEAEDVEVVGGLYSARHYAAKAAASLLAIVNGIAGWIHGATDKVTPDGADEIGLTDSADAWGLKRLTLTNLAAWLASLTQTLNNKTLTSPTINGTPVIVSMAGEVVMLPGGVIPAGRRLVKLNGASLSRATYADLWSYAQAAGHVAATEGGKTPSQFGPGNGSTTFSLPDWRGYFVRAFDDGRGIDTGRAISAIQAGALESHRHVGGVVNESEVKAQNSSAVAGAGNIIGLSFTGTVPSFATGFFGGTETRPVNLAALFAIRY